MAARDEFDDWTPAEIPKASTTASRVATAKERLAAAEPDNEEDVSPFVRHRAEDFPKPDLTNPTQFRASVRHISNLHAFGSPEEHEAGRLWYPKVHDAVSSGIHRTHLSHLQGSGLVAAVSPNMNFDKNNIEAFDEMHRLNGRQWAAIAKSANTNPGHGHQRTQEASDALRHHVTGRPLSISAAADNALLKAHRIYSGEDPDTVMPPQTSPKTNAFTHAIHDPSGRGLTTIDGRAHDIANNEMWPWMYSGRGISSSKLPSATKLKKDGTPGSLFGKRSRYESFSDAYHEASGAADIDPHAMQASTWLTGKRIETSGTTKAGNPRTKGVARRRQPYLGPPGG